MTSTIASPGRIDQGRSAPRIARSAFVPTLWLAGIAFVVYPLLRPFSSEAGRAGAEAFASTQWVVAHSFGIVGFVFLGLGLQKVRETLAPSGRLGRAGTSLAWLGIGLTLPYYGAEVFGLHAVGQQALKTGDWAQFSDLLDGIRWQAGLVFILGGLVLLALGAILLAVAVRREGGARRWAVVPMATALALYIPQYATAQPVRVAHGLLMAIGCVVAALAVDHATSRAVGPRAAVPASEG